MRQEILDLIDRMYDEKKLGNPFLDVGAAGTGYQKAQGYDLREKYAGYEATDIKADIGIDYVGDFATLELPKKYWTILCTETLEHVDNPVAVIANCYNHLKQDGYILVVAPDIYPVHSPQDYWRITENGLRNLCKIFELIEFGNLGREETKNYEHYFIGKK